MGNLPGIDRDRAKIAYDKAKMRMKVAKSRAGR